MFAEHLLAVMRADCDVCAVLVCLFVTLSNVVLQIRLSTTGQVWNILLYAYVLMCEVIVFIQYKYEKNDVYKNGYRRRNCISKTAKNHRFVIFVMSYPSLQYQ